MGRELRRVPLDFSWPLDKVWEGYLNPHYVECAACDGTGNTKSYRTFESIIRLLLIAGDDSRTTAEEARKRGRSWPHPYLTNTGMSHMDDVGTTLHELTTKLAGREPSPFGHDCCDAHSACRKVVKAVGLRKSWGICPVCKGNGIDPAHKVAYGRWRRKHPPKGPGYQLWETTTEGSPQSPVFGTLDELATWCETNATTFASERATAAEWKQMLSPDGMVVHKVGNLVFM